MLLISCSTTQKMGNKSADTGSNSVYPAWYSSSSEFTSTDSTYTAFGLAVGSDSTEALDKSIEKAKTNFEQHLSARLESIRTSASDELGANSSVSTSRFIFALRNAEATLSESVMISSGIANHNGELSSYRGFASVTITREDLIDNLDEQLDSHSAWEMLKTSQAFNEL